MPLSVYPGLPNDDLRVTMSEPDSNALLGRKALITGGNRGLGLEISRAYVAAGASVMLCARDAGLLGTAGRELAAAAQGGQAVRWVPADVTDPARMAAVGEETNRELGGLHLLV